MFDIVAPNRSRLQTDRWGLSAQDRALAMAQLQSAEWVALNRQIERSREAIERSYALLDRFELAKSGGNRSEIGVDSKN